MRSSLLKCLFFVAGLQMTFLFSQSQTTWSPGNGLTYYNDGNVGIGTSTPQARFHMVDNGISLNTTGQYNGNLMIQAVTGGRTITSGAQLEFTIPAGADGSNLWGQARIITVAGNTNSNDATGKMILGTRRWQNKLGSGTNWYYGDDITIDGSGNVGIGTTSPEVKFHVEGSQILNGDLKLGSVNNSLGYGKSIDFGQSSNSDPISIARFNTNVDQSELRINIGDDGNDRFVIGHHYYAENYNWKPSVCITSSGQMSVNTTSIPAGYKLAVGGNIIAEKVKVQLQQNWSDYVFNSDYKLPSLKDVEEFVKRNKHLPDIPSEKEVKTNGIDLGDNQALLLKKIEELTLYIIDINKKVDKLSSENEELKKKLTADKK